MVAFSILLGQTEEDEDDVNRKGDWRIQKRQAPLPLHNLYMGLERGGLAEDVFWHEALTDFTAERNRCLQRFASRKLRFASAFVSSSVKFTPSMTEAETVHS